MIAAQEVQKVNPYGSPEHRAAFYVARAEAAKYGAESFVGEYED